MKLLKKRAVSLLLAVVLLVGMMPMTVLASNEIEENLWKGRSAVFVGDSITAGSGTTKTYYQYLNETLGFGSVTAMGVAGSCISAASDYGQANQPLINRYQDIPSADLILVFMGTNDYGHETPLGTMDDTQDGTFYGALNVIVSTLVEKHPSSKIVFVTPLHRYGFGTSKILGTQFTSDSVPNGVGATLGDYVEALKTVCANNGVSVIDLYTECTLDPSEATVRANYMPDGLHPNVSGHELIAGIMESHIRSYLPVVEAPKAETELVYGNKFASGFSQQNRASSCVNKYLKAGTTITLKDPDVFQWACTKTSDENSCNNLGYFPDGSWSDKETAVVTADGWVGFVFKYRDEAQTFDLTKPLSDYITIEVPHNYENGICTDCGEVDPNLTNYKGKVISILGDSISTFAGYIPTADGFNLEHLARYPQDNLLTDVNETWWMQVIHELDAKLGINDSWRGATVSGAKPVTTGTTGENASMANLTRIQNLGSNGTPDVILFYGGTNDLAHVSKVGVFNPDDAPDTVDLVTTKWDNLVDGYANTILRLQYFYPDAQIICLLPTYTTTYYSNDKLAQGNEVLAEICKHYGVTYADLRYCGMTTADLPDGIHPGATGMDYITEMVLETLSANCDVEAGENIVYFVTHELNNAESSLGYYKGISLGEAFSTMIQGEELAVSVTMGGEDITDAVYANGIITIPAVTGDLVIKATGKQKHVYTDHLQQLPDFVCSETNLWTLLEHDKEYYTASGWGVHSSGKVRSVTIPIFAGDRIWATSFQASGINGSTMNGIRLTWFDETGVLESVSADKVYEEFSLNGYLTAPEGAVAVNVVMWNGDDSNEWYILNRDHVYENGVCIGCGALAPLLEGKSISILGASISTYVGISNNTDYNSTIGSNAVYYTEGRYGVYANDTWWMQAANDLGLELLVNNSWSGSSLLYERNGTVGAYVDRCVQLHNNDGEEPDIIAIQMGTNDFQYYKDTLGTADIDYDALINLNDDGSYTYAEPSTSLEAAAIVLHKISVRYPNAEVYYLNISQRVDGTDALIQSFNAELKQVVEHFGAYIVDIYGSAITMGEFDAYIGDGRVHPNKLGMDAYTEAFKRSLIANTEYKIDTHTVSFELDGVTADYGDDKIVVDGDSFMVKLTSADDMNVSVTMGGKDITADAYASGVVSIDAVTEDVTIFAEYTHTPQDYRWEFNGTDLICVDGDNTLTKNAGTTLEGVFTNTKYALEKAVVLQHDKPWVVEWKCEGTFQNSGSSSGARLFTSTDVNAEYNARYVFKSNKNGLIAMGEKTTTGSHNYGISLGDYGIDWTKMHTYRLENRIDADGSNMVYLLVDGVELGAMNHYYVGTTDKNTTLDWLAGKDFIFPYMGTDTHGFTNASIEYIQIMEEGHSHSYEDGVCTGCGGKDPNASISMPLRYDDHMDITGKTIEIIDAGTPTSYQVGYGVKENTVLDTAVITIEGENLVATGIGTATVKIDDVLYKVTVESAPISLLLLIGQSNMRGSEGNAKQSIVCPEGMVYATFGDDRGDAEGIMNVNNATKFAASALTGEYSTINVEGTIEHLSYYPLNSLTEDGAGTFGPDSGFAYEWVQQTGEKVWIVNAAHGGSAIASWQPNATNFKEAILLFQACQETLRKEIAAGHFTMSHMGYFWCQGCSDAEMTAKQYVQKYLAMHDDLKNTLAFDHDSDSTTEMAGLEFAGIIPVRAGHDYFISYREGTSNDTTEAKYYESFKDLRFTGPRVAQYWMSNNPELEDIWMVCNIGEDWVWMPDGTNGVTEYFQAHYENGTVDYTTQVVQSASWYTPTTPKAVHDSIHYNQIGYNEVGRESVRNILMILGETSVPNVETTIELLSWDGYTEVDFVTASDIGNSETLVVPKISPAWKAKEVAYALSDGLEWEYYDLLSKDESVDGILSVGDKTVSVKGHDWSDWETISEPSPEKVGQQQRNCDNCGKIETKEVKGVWQIYDLNAHLLDLPESVCCDTNLWTMLPHEDVHFTSGKKWGKTSTPVTSITIPVNSGDRLYATSWKKAVENGHATSNGIRVTFFDSYGIAKTMGPGQSDREFYANGGYLEAPAGTIAINIAMWYDSEDYEVYILNRDHTYKNGTCVSCGATQPGPAITKQPTNSEAKFGQRYMVEVKAEGEGLKYQWYFRNAGSKQWYKSGVKDSTYDDVMTAVRAGREVYCVITDANGNSVTTDTAKLIAIPSETLEIVTQPTNGEAVLGERYCVTVEAKGEGLKYQWYFRNAGSDKWYKSGVKDNTYDDVMTKARAGREVYCVITDANGNKVTTDTVKLVHLTTRLEITAQPTDTTAVMGEMFCAMVEAQGDNLKYQWYFRNAGTDTWHKSGVRDNTYDDIMTKARNGREIYCVITDAYGNTVITDIVKLIAVPSVELKLLGQTYESAAMGERYCLTVNVQGEGVKYQWYFRNAGSDKWYKSGVKDNTYDDVMTKARANRDVYCVITDALGNQVKTEVVTLTVEK